jgi:hypothetical protein
MQELTDSQKNFLRQHINSSEKSGIILFENYELPVEPRERAYGIFSVNQLDVAEELQQFFNQQRDTRINPFSFEVTERPHSGSLAVQVYDVKIPQPVVESNMYFLCQLLGDITVKNT